MSRFWGSGKFPYTNINNLNLDWMIKQVLELKAQVAALVGEIGDVYVKPDTGIPKSDLSAGVQASLDKADSALQSVPSTYRTATAQDQIDALQDAKINPLYTPVTLTGASVTANIARRALLTAAEVELPPLQNGTPSESSPIPLQVLSTVTVNSTALSLPSSFYGGVVDLLAGTIRAHCRHYVFDGSENWSNSGSGSRRYYSLALFDGHGVVDLNKNALCNYLPHAVITTSTTTLGVSVFESGSSGKTVLGIRPENPEDYTTPTWKQHLATLYNNGTPYEVVVWLFEPIETVLSPLHIDRVTSGTVAITTNYGTCKVEYDNYIEALSDFAATRAAVALIGANIEKTNIATRAYLSNDFIIVNDTLCKATANIQIGGTISIGVNAAVTTITAELAALLNS